MAQTKTKPSDRIALGAIAAGATAVGLVDYFIIVLNLWTSLIVGLVVAAGWYRAGLQFGAEKAVVDRLGK